MIHRPTFKPHLTPVLIPGEGVLLLSEDGARALHGRLYERLAPLLDGTRTPDELVTALADEFDAAHVYYALLLLEKNGHIEEAAPAISPTVGAFWSGLGVSAAAALAALAERSVHLRALGACDPAPLQTALAGLGIQIRTGSTEPTPANELVVVLTDDYLRPELAAINAELRADYTYMRAKGYTESGSVANLKVDGSKTDELILTVDGKVNHDLGNGIHLTANLGVGYDAIGDKSSLTSSFVGGGAAFTTKGIDPSRWLLRGGLGVVVASSKEAEITARYDIETRSSEYNNQTASIKVQVPF
ncbi:hypothetical protein MASR1M60_31260 [Rhodocyclaceae bacterium]